MGRAGLSYYFPPRRKNSRHHGTGTGAGADDAADAHRLQRLRAVFPQRGAVGHILLQQGVAEPRNSPARGMEKSMLSALVDLLHQQIVALPGATGLADDGHLAVRRRPVPGGCSAALRQRQRSWRCQILQRVHQPDDAHVLPPPLQQRRQLSGGEMGVVNGVPGQDVGMPMEATGRCPPRR